MQSPSDPSEREQESEKAPEPVKPVQLKPLTGPGALVEKVKIGVRRVAPILAISAGAGYGAGKIVEGKYRDVTGYEPDDARAESATDPAEDTEQRQWESHPGGRGIWGKARRLLDKAKRGATDAINDSAIGRTIDDALSELDEIKQLILEIGDKIAFWVPFLTVSLAFYYAARKIQKLYLRSFHPHDPTLVANIQALGRGIDEIGGRVNYLLARQKDIRDPAAIQASIASLTREMIEMRVQIDRLRSSASGREPPTQGEPPKNA